MIDELLLLSGNDIPFIEAKMIIHPPTIKQIAYIKEQNFWPACELLKFNKDNLNSEDKVNLSNKSNFNIIMMMMRDNSIQSQMAKIQILSLLALLFPTSKIKFTETSIQFTDNQTSNITEINEENFDIFKNILIEIFCLNSENKQYDPSGDLAKKIADKFRQGREKRAKLAPGNQKISVLSRYVSILAVGEHKSINQLMGYTVYQLMDELNRFRLKMEYDVHIQFKCAGATGLEQPADWFKDIHDNKK